MQRDLQIENQYLRKRINDLELQIKQNRRKYQLTKQPSKPTTLGSDFIHIDQKTCNSQIDYSPIHTCQSIQQETVSSDMVRKSRQDDITQQDEQNNPDKIQTSSKAVNQVKFQFYDKFQSDSNVPNSELSKELQNEQLKLKKSIQSEHLIQDIKAKSQYANSAIKERDTCEECINKLNQMTQIQFLKNKYHREYVSVRAQLEKLKGEHIHHQIHQTPRSSINLIDIYGEHTNEQKSEKSSFSFENIENAFLSERFSLQIQECIKLIDKLLPLDKKLIQLQSEDLKLLMDLEMKIEKLKAHLGIDTEPQFLQDLFRSLQKSDQTIKKIHEKYKKLFEKVVKLHKDKVKKSKEQIHQISEKLIIVLKDLHLSKVKNEKLVAQIQLLKSHSLSSSSDLKQSKQFKTTKQSASHQIIITKDKDLHQTALSQYQKSSSLSDAKTQKENQKLQVKLRNSEKCCKNLERTIKQLKFQLFGMKKKHLNDFDQFMNTIIFHSHSKLRNTYQQTEDIEAQESQQNKVIEIKGCQSQLSSKLYRIQKQKQVNLLQEIGSLVYEIFSFTSWQNDESQNIFLPQTEEQIKQMLNHIKTFTQKFDQWQKQKEKQINEFRKNFLHLLKFLIDNYKISEEDLLDEITKIQDNQPLLIYIKKYYSKAIELSEGDDRRSSQFTFGQKSESCKDSEPEPE